MGGDDTEGKHRFLSLCGEQGLVYAKYEDGEERYYLSRLLLRCMEDILSDEDEDESDEDGFDEDAYDEDETDGLREWGVSVWERFDAMSSVERGQEIISTERGFRLKKGSETSHDTWTDVELTVRFGKKEHLQYLLLARMVLGCSQ